MPYLSSPDAPYESSFWGSPTSQANFCEEDYQISRYTAEFINTISNAAYILFALYGYWRRPASSPLPWLALAAVGLLSGLYHASLLMHWQWGDMLSMHIGAGVVLQRIYTIGWNQTATTKFNVVLISFTVLVAVLRYLTGSDLFHDIAFATTATTASITTRRAIRNDPDEQFRQRARAQAKTGSALGLLAYGLWLIDVLVCSRLRELRWAVGLPWAFLLELHGWWHVLTAVGVYYYIDLVETLRERTLARSSLEQRKKAN